MNGGFTPNDLVLIHQAGFQVDTFLSPGEEPVVHIYSVKSHTHTGTVQEIRVDVTEEVASLIVLLRERFITSVEFRER